jgi:hypothetical protein
LFYAPPESVVEGGGSHPIMVEGEENKNTLLKEKGRRVVNVRR